MSICLLILTVLWASKICVCDVVHSQDTHTHFLTFLLTCAVHIHRNIIPAVYIHTHINIHQPLNVTPPIFQYTLVVICLFKLESHYKCNSLPKT